MHIEAPKIRNDVTFLCIVVRWLNYLPSMRVLEDYPLIHDRSATFPYQFVVGLLFNTQKLVDASLKLFYSDCSPSSRMSFSNKTLFPFHQRYNGIARRVWINISFSVSIRTVGFINGVSTSILSLLLFCNVRRPLANSLKIIVLVISQLVESGWKQSSASHFVGCCCCGFLMR